MKKKIFITALLCIAIASVWVCYSQTQGVAQTDAKYVGPEACTECHPDTAKTWAMTVHRRTLFNKDESKKGCESCHGPGSEHIDGGGDPNKIIKPEKLKPEQSAAICQKCHTQESVTLWRTSTHARSKLTCINCHDSHNPSGGVLGKDIETGKLEIDGLTTAIKQAELAADIAKEGSEEKTAANEKVAELKAKRATLLEKLKGIETVYQRTAEPYVCYSCHKAQQAQSKLPSRHPIPENKMKCSDCHNPHGGPHGMLKAESVTETCAKCHAEKVGPFTFEHPPVTEDCTICHSPHGSVQNNLLTQSEPFVCMKCHAGPHSRNGSLGNPTTMGTYYTECTDCHSEVHGSDEHAPLHY